MGIKRCQWKNLENNPIYVEYHDNEWGVASYDDKYLFEMLILESGSFALYIWSFTKGKVLYGKSDMPVATNFRVKKLLETKDDGSIIIEFFCRTESRIRKGDIRIFSSPQRSRDISF